MNAAVHVFAYLKGTIKKGLVYKKDNSSLIGYIDSD